MQQTFHIILSKHNTLINNKIQFAHVINAASKINKNINYHG